MISSFRELVERTKDLEAKRIAVAGAESKDVLLALMRAKSFGIAEPLLLGSEPMIKSRASELGMDLGGILLYNKVSANESAKAAVKLVTSSQADLIMKGMISTAEIVKAVLKKSSGLRTDRILSHIMVYEIPGYRRFVLVTDAAVNIAPSLQHKIDILRNAIHVARSLGIKQPKIAALAALEKVNPDMPSTVEAAELTKMGQAGNFGDCIVDGPLALDDALNPETARKKGVSSPVSGGADILLAHDLESANLLGKSIAYIGQAAYAGVIMGAKVPLIIVGRGSTPASMLHAIALGVVIASSENNEH
ncbi:bifunctional enoyl-CoA hydratase/phosphate acetyltransferase [Acidobacteriota bacterium]